MNTRHLSLLLGGLGLAMVLHVGSATAQWLPDPDQDQPPPVVVDPDQDQSATPVVVGAEVDYWYDGVHYYYLDPDTGLYYWWDDEVIVWCDPGWVPLVVWRHHDGHWRDHDPFYHRHPGEHPGRGHGRWPDGGRRGPDRGPGRGPDRGPDRGPGRGHPTDPGHHPLPHPPGGQGGHGGHGGGRR